MKRVLITGMSGTGKSTVICELAARGYKTVDTDDAEWLEPVPDPSSATGESDWVWHEDRIHRLLSMDDAEFLFVSGCRTNQGKFYPQFDHIILLSAPTPILVERLSIRTNNPYGKHPDELDQVLGYIQTVEPLLRRRATLEVDTSAPVDEVIEIILNHVCP